MKRKFGKKLLPFLLALALVITSGGFAAFANEAETDPEYNHGRISVTADGSLEMEVGDELEITISPYVHMQYIGCQMNGCPAICGGYDCFITGYGCTCETEPVVRYATVTVTSGNENVVTSDGTVTQAEGTIAEVGDMADGTVTVTAVGGGTTTVKVTAALCDWESASVTFTVTVNGDSIDDTDSGNEDNTGSGTEDEDNTGSGTEDEDNTGSGTEDEDNTGTGTEDEDNTGTGTEDEDNTGTGTEDKVNTGTGTEDEDNTGSGTGESDTLEAPTLQTTSASLRYTGATTGTAPTFDLYVSGGSSDWADSVTSVSIVDLRDDSVQVLTEDQFTVTSSKISLYRTDEDPIMSVTTAERTADFEILVAAEGYEDLDETYTVNMYGAQTFQLRYLDGDGNIITSKTFTKAEIMAMSQSEELYYNTICSMTGLRSFRAKGAYLSDLLDAAGIDFSEGMTMVLRTNDMAETENDSTTEDAYYSTYGTFTYEEMMGTARYAFTDIYTNETLKADILSCGKFDEDVRTLLGSTAQKTEVDPLIAYNYIELQYPQTGGESIYNYDYSDLTGYENSFRFLFGIAMDEENSSMISDTTTTWSASYGVFGIDIIDENYDADANSSADDDTDSSTNGSTGNTSGTVVSESADTLVVRRGNTYYFSYSIKSGNADKVIAYGKATDEVLVGDWDGDGLDTLCVRRGNTYYFSNSLKSGEADKVIAYGKATDEVLVGDWDGDGADTLCVRRGNTYYFSNSLKSGNADSVIAYGKTGDTVLVGKWDGNASGTASVKDTLAVRRGNTYYFNYSLKSGDADKVAAYGKATDEVLVGDWNGSGNDTLTVRRGNIYYISNSIRSGSADIVIAYGKATDEVYAGCWGL